MSTRTRASRLRRRRSGEGARSVRSLDFVMRIRRGRITRFDQKYKGATAAPDGPRRHEDTEIKKSFLRASVARHHRRLYRIHDPRTSEIVSSTTDRSVVIVLTTLGAATDAAAFARVLVGDRLAACVNVLPPMTSLYRWKGAIEEDSERQLVIKTTSDRVAAIEARFQELHPYELPEFIVLSAGASAPYLEWLGDSVKGT